MQEPGDRAAAPTVVAIFNNSPDIVAMLRIALERAGFLVVSALIHDIRNGVVDLESFAHQHRPTIVVFDLAPPYDVHWRTLQHYKAMPFLANCYFVVTSTNKVHAEKLAGGDMQIFEIIGTPYDLKLIVEAVQEAVKWERPSPSDTEL